MTWKVEWVGGEVAEWDGRHVACTDVDVERQTEVLLAAPVQPQTPTGPWHPSDSDSGAWLAFVDACLLVHRQVPSWTLSVGVPEFTAPRLPKGATG